MINWQREAINTCILSILWIHVRFLWCRKCPSILRGGRSKTIRITVVFHTQTQANEFNHLFASSRDPVAIIQTVTIEIYSPTSANVGRQRASGKKLLMSVHWNTHVKSDGLSAANVAYMAILSYKGQSLQNTVCLVSWDNYTIEFRESINIWP